MRKITSMAAILTMGLPLAPLTAQEAADQDVASYLCTFAGKCDDAPAVEETRAAPATKGFSLARARPQQQTQAAPETRGFSIARPKPQDKPAPDTRGFSITRASAKPASRPTATRPVRATSESRARPTRSAAPVRSAPAPSGGTRADLQLSFELNSAMMTPSAQARAEVFARALAAPELRNSRFVIEGHTDSIGSRDINLDLSQRRAQAVADYLVSQGIDRTRLEVKGYGPDRPLPGRSARAAENRRVEAMLIS